MIEEQARRRRAAIETWVDQQSPDRPRTEAVPAATVVVLRDGPAGLEVLMVRRSSRLDFAGGHWVFPGGRVDPADLRPGEADELGASRRAAVRETAEEAGLRLAEDRLVVLSHWIPPEVSPKRFSTWFFLAPDPSGDVVVDGGEIRAHLWATPGEAIARRDAGEIELLPPTWVTLHGLTGHHTARAALDHAAAREPQRFVSRLARAGDEVVALYPGDAGYETGDALASGPRHRLWLLGAGWRYEQDPDPGAF